MQQIDRIGILLAEHAAEVKDVRRYSRPTEERKTLREWEQTYGLWILDMDGFDLSDHELFQRRMTKSEFLAGLAYCTALRRSDAHSNAVEELPEANSERPVVYSGWKRKERSSGAENASTLEKTRLDIQPPDTDTNFYSPQTLSRKRQTIRWRLLCVVPLPYLAIWGATLIKEKLERYLRIRWYWWACILLLDLGVISFAPIVAVLIAFLYPWYLVAAGFARLFGWLREHILNLFHQSSLTGMGLHTPLNAPFLSNITVDGNPANLYFHFSTALASSFVWGSMWVSISALLNLLRRLSSSKSNRARS